LGTWSSR